MSKEKLERVLKKASILSTDSSLGLANEFISLEDKINDVKGDFKEFSTEIKTELNNLSEGLKKKLEEELVYEVNEDQIADNVLLKIPKPKNGEDYILTKEDKKDIADSIKVPVVEKVVEKVEVIKEQPIEKIVEKAIYETGEQIAERLSAIPSPWIDANKVKGLEDLLKSYKPIIGGGARKLSNLIDVRLTNITNGQVLKYNSTTKIWENQDSGGGGDVTKVGTPVNNQMAVWTGDGTLEGTSDFTYDGTSLNLITGKNFQIAGATILADVAGTTTLSNIDALDVTTESTIESAIDTLANLTSIQGRTVTLVDAGANAIFGWDDVA